MPEYVILVHPSANRVYAASSPALLRAELAVFGAAGLAAGLTEVEEVELGGVGYVKFTSPSPLTADDLALLSNLSSLYALFELGEGVLRPVTVTPLAKTDSDLLTIQKYPGKTNEQFTKLLLNITLLATDVPAAWPSRPLRLLDPLCGRGTTLNQAMMYGFDATGLDVDGKDFEAYEAFLKTWLRNKRVKHTADSGPLRRNKIRLGRRLAVEYAFDKDAYRSGETRQLTFFNADTLTADELLRPASVDIVVTDAPYGVQHGSHREAGLTRSPRDLLAAAVPVWTRVLRPGGALGISWNTHVLPRKELVAVLKRAGLEVREGGPYEQFAHRVDQAIVRDLVVAAKPA
ncbi:SAM-dependent methyltransferase [Amycolatopsis sp. PS_44_ISF1]|uniref:TRM11 family SAM-dependent methyltransferase n=1 Tax=Amycolatopsis sp. PS_44_ISF1 TaxID=2974917 RepID=UPI0028DF0E6A|nr:SAM-dependent methyltransferase [Amycolatopsis sp. PS_44_ISF1]MDT8914802.1 SAM-dependent methyltransferase [Amycolatopsis sp. PS_44_ISF1]